MIEPKQKFSFKTREGINKYQRWYYKTNIEQKEKQKERARKNNRNKRNKNKCTSEKKCFIYDNKGICLKECSNCCYFKRD